MRVTKEYFGTFSVTGLSREDLQGLKQMIVGAKLPERRQFNSLLADIDSSLK